MINLINENKDNDTVSRNILELNLPAGGNFHGVKRIGQRSTIICRIDSDPKQTRMD